MTFLGNVILNFLISTVKHIFFIFSRLVLAFVFSPQRNLVFAQTLTCVPKLCRTIAKTVSSSHWIRSFLSNFHEDDERTTMVPKWQPRRPRSPYQHCIEMQKHLCVLTHILGTQLGRGLEGFEFRISVSITCAPNEPRIMTGPCRETGGAYHVGLCQGNTSICCQAKASVLDEMPGLRCPG